MNFTKKQIEKKYYFIKKKGTLKYLHSNGFDDFFLLDGKIGACLFTEEQAIVFLNLRGDLYKELFIIEI